MHEAMGSIPSKQRRGVKKSRPRKQRTVQQSDSKGLSTGWRDFIRVATL